MNLTKTMAAFAATALALALSACGSTYGKDAIHNDVFYSLNDDAQEIVQKWMEATEKEDWVSMVEVTCYSSQDSRDRSLKGAKEGGTEHSGFGVRKYSPINKTLNVSNYDEDHSSIKFALDNGATLSLEVTQSTLPDQDLCINSDYSDGAQIN